MIKDSYLCEVRKQKQTDNTMALQYKVPASGMDERWWQARFEEPIGTEDTEIRNTFMPAEWFPQSGVQLTWPHAETDWCDMLEEVTECYIKMAYEIASREPLLIVTPEQKKVERLLRERLPSHILSQIIWCECPTNDTWARDHGFITLLHADGPELLDFCFNGWGMKFAADKDNQINRCLFRNGVMNGNYCNCLDFVFEGGSIESDGRGTLLTTSECLLSPNRNDHLSRADIEERLKKQLHADRVLWLDHGYLAGDDTDSHIDTLARLCPNDTIAYVKCEDTTDEHYEELHLMEEQLQTFRTANEQPYRLIALPIPDAVYDEDGVRLPATYANFLVVNKAVLMPTYNQPIHDEQAIKALQKAFPKHEIVGIDCRPLIKQHGSLHCCTMQFPITVLNTSQE